MSVKRKGKITGILQQALRVLAAGQLQKAEDE